LLKNLSADATVVEIVKDILKLIQTFGNNSHTSHMAATTALKHCRNTVSRVGSITSFQFNYNYNYNYALKSVNCITITIILC